MKAFKNEQVNKLRGNENEGVGWGMEFHDEEI